MSIIAPVDIALCPSFLLSVVFRTGSGAELLAHQWCVRLQLPFSI